MNKSIDKIDDDEQVARILFSPSHIYHGRVSPRAFRLEHLKNTAEDYISVLRDDESQLENVSTFFRPRTEGDVRYGYTLLNAAEVHSLDKEINERSVLLKPKPSKRLPWHAGIYLYLSGKLQTADDFSPDVDYFLKELPMICDGVHRFR